MLLRFLRFLTHLKFLAIRIYHPEEKKRIDPKFVTAMADIYPMEFEYSQKIMDFVHKTTGNLLSQEEKAYLTIHLYRIQC